MALVNFIPLALEIRSEISADLRAFVPIDPEPAQAVVDRSGCFLGVAGLVSVLDAENESAAVMAGEEPVKKCGARPADVQKTGRRGSETNADVGVHGLLQLMHRVQRSATIREKFCPTRRRACRSPGRLILATRPFLASKLRTRSIAAYPMSETALNCSQRRIARRCRGRGRARQSLDGERIGLEEVFRHEGVEEGALFRQDAGGTPDVLSQVPAKLFLQVEELFCVGAGFDGDRARRCSRRRETLGGVPRCRRRSPSATRQARGARSGANQAAKSHASRPGPQLPPREKVLSGTSRPDRRHDGQEKSLGNADVAPLGRRRKTGPLAPQPRGIVSLLPPVRRHPRVRIPTRVSIFPPAAARTAHLHATTFRAGCDRGDKQ